MGLQVAVCDVCSSPRAPTKRLRVGGQSVLKYVVSFAECFDRVDLRHIFVRRHMFCHH